MDTDDMLDMPIGLRDAGFVSCSGPARVYHQHPGVTEIHYVAGGKGRFLHGKRRHALTPRMLFISEENCRHGFELAAGDSIAFYFLRFDQKAFSTHLRHVLSERMRKSGYLAVSYDQRALFEGCVSRTRHDNPLMVRSAEHLALAFLYKTAYSAGKTTAAKPNPLIEASLALMQKEMSRQITLPEIAAKVGLSEGYFSRFFKRATGTTPMVYLTRIRIDSAAYLLTSSALTVRAIAQQVGFRDEFHFSRVFKKLKGWSPSRFREVHDDIASQR